MCIRDSRGTGRKNVSKKIKINIPAGIDDGQTLMLRGSGSAGANGGPSGDLNVAVTVRPDPLFKRRGFDILCEIPVTYTPVSYTHLLRHGTGR